MKHFIPACLIFATLCLSPALAGEFIVLSNHLPPIKMVEQGIATGFAGDLLAHLLEKNGHAVSRDSKEVSTLSEGYAMVRGTPNTVFLGVERTHNREKNFKWVGPICEVNLGFIGHTGRDLKINSVGDANRYKVGTIKGSGSERLALQMGLAQEQVIRVDTPQEAIKLIADGTVDLVVMPKSPVFYGMLQNRIDPKQYDIIYEMESVELYFAFNKSTNNALIRELQGSLNSLRSSDSSRTSEYDNIIRRYFVPLI